LRRRIAPLLTQTARRSPAGFENHCRRSIRSIAYAANVRTTR
jgi:hypothetical protein